MAMAGCDGRAAITPLALADLPTAIKRALRVLYGLLDPTRALGLGSLDTAAPGREVASLKTAPRRAPAVIEEIAIFCALVSLLSPPVWAVLLILASALKADVAKRHVLLAGVGISDVLAVKARESLTP